MSILRDVFSGSYGNNGTTYDSGPWAQGMVRWGNPGLVGAAVTTESSMQLSAVFACMRILSENIATMPLDTFIRSGGTRAPYRPKPAYLSFQPPQGSRIDYLSQVMLSLLSDGNAFVATPRDEFGVPQTLVVIDPCQVKVEREKDGQIYFTVGPNRYDEFDVTHIKGMAMPGALRGLSPLAYARKSVALGLAAQDFGAAFFDNGALPAGIIEAPNDYPQAAAERMATLWETKHRGTGKAGRIGVLTGGARFTKVTIAPEEMQFIETRQFQVPDIARFFGVPPHLIADASNSTSWGSGLAEQNSAFGQMSLRPWVDRIEDAHGRLLTTQGLPDVFVRLNMDAVLRADTRERYDAYAVGIQNAYLTVNEVRRLEDMPPVAWGDTPMYGRDINSADVASIVGTAAPAAVPATPVSPTGGKP